MEPEILSQHGGNFLSVIIFLLPLALLLGGLGLAAFLWALNSVQYDDLEGEAWRILDDDEEQ